jgi:hypothetical protein
MKMYIELSLNCKHTTTCVCKLGRSCRTFYLISNYNVHFIFAKGWSYCANCLAHEHSQGKCRSKDKCRICNRAHHTLLHFHEHRLRRSPSVQPATQVQSPSLTTLLHHRNPKLLPTATILIDNGSKVFETRALIDACTSVSRIDASFASATRLASVNVGREAACAAVIRSKASDGFRLDADH